MFSQRIENHYSTITEVADVAIGNLGPHDRNPRKHSKKQLERIAASIRRFGFQRGLSSGDVLRLSTTRFAIWDSLRACNAVPHGELPPNATPTNTIAHISLGGVGIHIELMTAPAR